MTVKGGLLSLTVFESFCPCHLPCWFTCVTLVAVCVSPCASAEAACDLINPAVARQQEQ